MATILKIVGYGCFVIAVIMMFAGNLPDVVRIGMVLSCAMTGLIFLGVARALDLLTDIKRAVVVPELVIQAADLHDGKPLRSLEQLEADLQAIRAR